MLKSGEYVMYSWYGACQIESRKEIVVDKITKMYYVLKPLNDEKATVMIPVDNQKLRPVISKKEAFDMLEAISDMPVSWIENKQARDKTQMKTLKEKNMPELLCMMKTLVLKRKEILERGHKFPMQDSKVLDMTEDYLFSELSVSLGMKPADVKKRVDSQIFKTLSNGASSESAQSACSTECLERQTKED